MTIAQCLAGLTRWDGYTAIHVLADDIDEPRKVGDWGSNHHFHKWLCVVSRQNWLTRSSRHLAVREARKLREGLLGESFGLLRHETPNRCVCMVWEDGKWRAYDGPMTGWIKDNLWGDDDTTP